MQEFVLSLNVLFPRRARTRTRDCLAEEGKKGRKKEKKKKKKRKRKKEVEKRKERHVRFDLRKRADGGGRPAARVAREIPRCSPPQTPPHPAPRHTHSARDGSQSR